MEEMILRTERLVLRAPRPADVDEITAACQDPEVLRWTPLPSPYSRSNAEFWVEKLVPAGWQNRTNLNWAVRTGAGELVGAQSLGFKADRPGTAEIGFWTAAEHRGHGYAFEAASALVDAAFGELGVHRLEWVAYAGNEASLALAEKLGFRLEGTLRSYAEQRGVHRDAWMGALLATDPR